MLAGQPLYTLWRCTTARGRHHPRCQDPFFLSEFDRRSTARCQPTCSSLWLRPDGFNGPSLPVRASAPVRYVHYIFTHLPVLLESNCEQTARAGVNFVPRRTLTHSVPRHAQEDGSNNNNNKNNNNNENNNEGTGKPQSASKPSALSSIKDFFFGGKSTADTPKPTIRRAAAPTKREGSLSADSIFAEDEASPKLRASGRTPSRRPTEAVEGEGAEEEEGGPLTLEERNRATMKPVLDPRPHARTRWERKMVIRELRRRGRLSKTEEVMRTERESLSKSHWFKTSIKKLGPLARQISGKNIDEAILQMRFSSKKAAKDVLGHLEHAKNFAVVRSGMGIGGPGVATPAGQGQSEGETAAPQKPINIVLKSGQRKTITDPSSIYISQAWVNRGPYGVDYDHRARGQINILRPPYTSLSVLLKEEHSRVREWQDREANEQRKRKTRVWTQLPDRKISAQNQYYSW